MNKDIAILFFLILALSTRASYPDPLDHAPLHAGGQWAKDTAVAGETTPAPAPTSDAKKRDELEPSALPAPKPVPLPPSFEAGRSMSRPVPTSARSRGMGPGQRGRGSWRAFFASLVVGRAPASVPTPEPTPRGTSEPSAPEARTDRALDAIKGVPAAADIPAPPSPSSEPALAGTVAKGEGSPRPSAPIEESDDTAFARDLRAAEPARQYVLPTPAAVAAPVAASLALPRSSSAPTSDGAAVELTLHCLARRARGRVRVLAFATLMRGDGPKTLLLVETGVSSGAAREAADMAGGRSAVPVSCGKLVLQPGIF